MRRILSRTILQEATVQEATVQEATVQEATVQEAMNPPTQLFLAHLRSSIPAGEALCDWLHQLDSCGDETQQGALDPTFRFMTAMQKELLSLVAGIDLYRAVYKFQEDLEFNSSQM